MPSLAGASLVAAAFDAEAATYEMSFSRSPAARLFRYDFQRRFLRRLNPSSVIADLGCGTGEDAVAYAAAGHRVVGVDVSGAMIEEARSKASRAEISDRARFERRSMEDLADLGPFDAIASNFGAVNCVDLVRLGQQVASRLRPRGVVSLAIMRRASLPAFLRRPLSRGLTKRAPRVGGRSIDPSFPTPADVRAAFGSSFRWTGRWSMGCIVPGPEHADWPSRHPNVFAASAAAESLAGAWPILRDCGDHVVLEGVRR